ncbi:MAG TPA: thiamine pyrophosphate-dependent enzyme [Bdellovibrionales bacterium]|nr:thiamine pyrophosphate-dependent enzyme [Bdellovibrionales bacterium]
MYNRAAAVDENFLKFVAKGHLPPARSHTGLDQAGLTPAEFMDLFETQIMSRQMDLRARILKNQNECFYTIGSSGHEVNAVWGKAFRLTDMAFVHYRSCAFMIQRAKQIPGSTPLYDTMLSFVASSEDPIAGGRHKVFGSYPLMVPPQTSTIASHLPKAMGAALSIGRAKDLQLETAVMPNDAVVICSFGDASTNHSTAVGAINSALWVAHQNISMPLVFLCEDNGVGISVFTPQMWLESQYGERSGMHYILCDGLSLTDTYRAAREAEHHARVRRKPVFLHTKTVRLLGHAGSDVESTYQQMARIEATEFNDPLLHSARFALENDLATADQILKMYKTVEAQVAAIGEYTKTRPKYLKREEVRESLVACAHPKTSPAPVDAHEMYAADLGKPLHLAKLINLGLQETLARYPGAVVFGEDVAQKGGVYNVTEGLYKKFGPRRVFNSPLDEQTILGTAIGFAHNGFLPIPEIQFLAYVHNAEDQLRGEAATLAFFSQGQFTNGMIVRIAGLPYQKGFGGHFHNDNSLAIFRDIPGLILAVPSNGEDAVKMLRACAREAWENGRVVVFVEPIALYMTRDLHEANDKAWTGTYPTNGEIAVGEFGVHGASDELTIVTYGNGTFYSRQAAKILSDEHGLKTKIIDMRWLTEIKQDRLMDEIGDCPHVLIVDECRKTGSWSEWMCGLILEKAAKIPRVKVVAADDCFIPLGLAAAAGLPSRDEIVTEALRLTNRV